MAASQKFCPQCGTPNVSEAVFCMSCGSRFPAVAAPAASAAPTPPPLKTASGTPVPPLPRSGQSDFITLSCPNCGGKLQITPDIERFACQYCGYEHIVRRNGGIVSLEPVVRVMQNIDANINLVGVGVNRLGASSEKQIAEQTIARLKTEIAELNKQTGSYYDAAQIAMILGGILAFGGILLIVLAIMNAWSAWVYLVGLVLGGFGVVLFVSVIKEPPHIKAQHELERQKSEELQRNYEIVRRSDR
ncbi:MAG: zinc-ribbon domain-containing protein [Anaerolineaceae bacterium]|nr:zinc-ribbon domain-containing protein [Anaerolineaceae bacterium]